MPALGLLRTGEDFEIDWLNDITWERESDGHTLKGSISLKGHVNEKRHWQVFHATDQCLAQRPEVDTADGSIKIITYVAPRKTEFYTMPGYLVVAGPSNKKWLSELIMYGIDPAPPPDSVYRACIDTDAILRDNPGIWRRTFRNRRGYTNRGMHEGRQMELDEVMNRQLDNTACPHVGWTVHMFGGETDVRATRSGTFEILKDVTENQVLEFKHRQIDKYIIDCGSQT